MNMNVTSLPTLALRLDQQPANNVAAGESYNVPRPELDQDGAVSTDKPVQSVAESEARPPLDTAPVVAATAPEAANDDYEGPAFRFPSLDPVAPSTRVMNHVSETFHGAPTSYVHDGQARNDAQVRGRYPGSADESCLTHRSEAPTVSVVASMRPEAANHEYEGPSFQVPPLNHTDPSSRAMEHTSGTFHGAPNSYVHDGQARHGAQVSGRFLESAAGYRLNHCLEAPAAAVVPLSAPAAATNEWAGRSFRAPPFDPHPESAAGSRVVSAPTAATNEWAGRRFQAPPFDPRDPSFRTIEYTSGTCHAAPNSSIQRGQATSNEEVRDMYASHQQSHPAANRTF
jgi:hypothetical protein